MIISKKIIIYITSAVIIFTGATALFWRLDEGDSDNAKHIAECGLSPASGEALAIRQGTVGRFSGISIGLKSIKDGKANMQLWNSDANISETALTLGPCESADFEEYTIYVLAVEDRFENPFGAPGSGSDSVKIFIKKH